MYERSPAKLQRQPGVESFQTLLFLSLLRSCRMNMQERLCQRLSVLPDTLSAIRIGSDKCVCLSPLLKTLQSCLWNGPTDLFLTRQRMTHSASWMERSASSITSLLEPRTTMLTVFPGLVQPVICTEQHKTFTGSFKTVSGQTLHSEVCLLFNFLSSAAKYFMWSVKCDADLDQLARAVQADFLCQLRCAEHLWSEVVDVGDGLGTKSLNGREELWERVYLPRNNNICAVTLILRDAERQTEQWTCWQQI